MPRFAKYAWFAVAYNIFVILWGAYVRATGSGAGCGDHWPLCNGDVLPRSPQIATIIEFTHRLTSGLALLLIIGLTVLAFRWYPRKSAIRHASVLSLAFTVTEALVGAGLVLLGHVAANQSIMRGWSLSMHLVNTMMLLASLAATAWLATPRLITPSLHISAKLRGVLYLCFAAFLAVGVTGAVAALGDTLFKADSLAAGMRQDFDPSSHPFVRLRIIHPFLAVITGGALIGLGLAVLDAKRFGKRIPNLAYAVIGATVLQIVLGAMNLLLLAPVWMQLVHLLVADLLWIFLVLLGAELLGLGQASTAAPPALVSRGAQPIA